MAHGVLDTDVASVIYKDLLPDSLATQLSGHTPCLTFVTVGEMTRWAEKRQWGVRRRTDLFQWIYHKPVLPADFMSAVRWGRMMAASSARGRSRPVNDGWMAATCLQACLPLATNNVKDFDDLVEHEGLKLITL